jgi:hypothetical protein
MPARSPARHTGVPQTIAGGQPQTVLAQSAHALMERWPAKHGWQRMASRPCGGHHDQIPGMGQLVYWRRRRDVCDDQYRPLPEDQDPAMCVVESITSAICCDWFFHRANLICNASEAVAAGLGRVWTFDGDYGPAMRVHLNAANGHWVYVCVGEKQWCGGYLARWAD